MRTWTRTFSQDLASLVFRMGGGWGGFEKVRGILTDSRCGKNISLHQYDIAMYSEGKLIHTLLRKTT